MNTTNLIVELIVIGVGASIWVSLLILALFGYTWIPGKDLLATPALILAPGLAIVYLLGVVTDRLSDSLLGKLWSGKWMERTYGSNRSQYYRDRALIFHKSE